MSAPPLSLYVHFPWCVAKCPYCDFNSHSLRGELPADDYVDALISDISSTPDEFRTRPLQTIFFGGGTPSLFSPAHFERLLNAVAAQLQIAPAAEITLEANPGAVEHAAFAGYRAAGINRLSLGVQSFDDEKLTALGRIHTAADAAAAYTEAREAGFDNINLDLMYALPGQSIGQAVADVSAAVALAPEHISWYHLTLEPNTVFYARPPALPDEDLSWEIQLAGAEELTSAGYRNYEISAWGRPGREARHNLNYWRFGDYLAAGAGAHAKLTGADGRVWREVRPAHPRAYLDWAGSPGLGRQYVGAEDLQFEFMLNRLRLREGFTLMEFEALTAVPAGDLEPRLSAALERGLLEESDGNFRPSATGWRFLDDLQGIFLPGQ